MRRVAAALLVMVALLGCEPTDQSAPATISDGAREIKPNLVGQWKAPGGSSCRWWFVRNGVITNNGNTEGPATRRRQKSGKAADQSQNMIIGHGNVGDTLRSDKCAPKGWTRA